MIPPAAEPTTDATLRVLVLAPTARDSRLAIEVLAGAGIAAQACRDVAEVCTHLEVGAGAVIIAEQALAQGGRPLAALLAAQPTWSDLPILVLTRSGQEQTGIRDLGLAGSVTFLGQPLPISALVSAARSALRARSRQYQIKALLEERERSVAALAASEARYRAVGETLPFGAWAADPSGRFTHISESLLQFLGVPREEALRTGWYRFLPEETAARVHVEWQRAIAAERLFGFELEVRGVEGDVRHVLVRGAPLRDDDGRLLAWVGMNLDVSDRRRLEEDMARIGRLESIAVLASGIAHDFNNTLTAVIANVSLAQRQVGRDGPGAERLDAAYRAGRHAQKVVRQLLTFARGGAPVRQPADLGPVIQEAVDFALQGSAIRAEVRCHALPTVDADVGQIVQVVQNLVINSAQASTDGGSIRVEAFEVEVPPGSRLPLEPGRYVTMLVSDEGTGISAADLPHIFDPFFSKKAGGTGLGLATAHSIVHRHGGHITARSTPGVGTTMQVYLPVSFAAAERAIAPPHEPGGRHGRVLVMDDDDGVRDAAQASLAHLGYSVDVAVDGAQALRLYRSARAEGKAYDVVVLDLTVPGGMGGREAMARLRELDPEVRAIVASGYSNDPVVSDFRSYGFRASVAKPYDVDALAAAVGALVE